MRKIKFFAALCCTAMLFAACEKSEPTNNSSKDPIDQDQEQEQEDGDTSVLTGKENGHDWVDLGLPSGLKWATCNVGATKPENYGDYYAWGETETKETFSWSTYKYGSDYDAITKYCTDSYRGTVDNKTTLEAADDAATQNWGSNWRMPTEDEWEELSDYCTWTWTIRGYEVKSSNGNSIFLPAAGRRYDGELEYAHSEGNYWSSSLSTDVSFNASIMFFGSGFRWVNIGEKRYYGRSVRPVCEK